MRNDVTEKYLPLRTANVTAYVNLNCDEKLGVGRHRFGFPTLFFRREVVNLRIGVVGPAQAGARLANANLDYLASPTLNCP
ncbi:hypothetical protein EVAR_48339_1 [Eumeta japonica]|uniref:Uncharacterized protein n=1 Tax=Eumeta variegata TaxID=151549 RepID=A0A4C1WMA4_EUMVA|nr:hypothetical protein EVAR_48339_1 [Eumeta japonica]